MKKRRYSYLVFVLILTILMTACSGSKKDSSSTAYDTSYSGESEAMNMTAEYDGADMDYNSSPEEKPTEDAGSGALTSTSSAGTSSSNQVMQEKIIKTFYLDVETQEFDNLITKIGSEINRLEGYVESSEISGKRYYYSSEARYGSIIARIPADKVDQFVNTVNKSANVVNKDEKSRNVSLEYIEAESRVETLKIEQERLFAILEKELKLENIITLESRLSDIRYELQDYQSKLRYYDNQVEYSTVTLSIQEVEKLTPVVVKKQTVGERISNGFSDTMYNISEGFKNFFVWFVVNLPYLIIWGIIITIVVIIIRKALKKYNVKNQTQVQNRAPIYPQNLSQPNQSNGNVQKKDE